MTIECPGVKVEDVRVEFDGHSRGKVQIQRKESPAVEALGWEMPISLNSGHEFVASDMRRENSKTSVSDFSEGRALALVGSIG